MDIDMFLDFAMSKCLCLHLQVYFGIDVRTRQTDMPQPSSYRVDVYACTKQMYRACMPDSVGTNMFGPQRRYPAAFFAYMPFNEGVDSEAGNWLSTPV